MATSKNSPEFESAIRFFDPPSSSYFLFGPRGTGKSTFIRSRYPHAVIVDLLDVSAYRQYLTNPNRLVEIVRGNPGVPIVIDEVQRVPDLLTIVHQLIEENKATQFILTGSSARKLKRSGVDLLAGRAALRHFHPFMASELGEKFNLDQALQIGLLPLVLGSPGSKDTLHAYISLYLREEVQMEGLTRRIDHFGRFVEAVSFSQGSILNYSNIARDCGVSSKSVETYIAILEDLLLAYRVPVFARNATRQVIQHPKFYYFDSGVYQSIRPSGPLDHPEEIGGIALETVVFQHLIAWINYSNSGDSLYYWRTKTGLEVDFIVYGQRSFYAIEVKNSARIRTDDLKGLRAFGSDFPQARRIFLYRGDEQREIDGILCMPCDKFLRTVFPGRALFDSPVGKK